MVDFTLGRQDALAKETRNDTLMSATFKLLMDSNEAMFSELGGISSEVEQAEYMEAGANGPLFGRFIGRAKPPTVVLKRAMTKGGDLNDTTKWIWVWHGVARSGSSEAYKDVLLYLYGAGKPDPVKVYALTNAIPTKLEIAGMKAGGTEVVLQTLTMMCDAIEENP